MPAARERLGSLRFLDEAAERVHEPHLLDRTAADVEQPRAPDQVRHETEKTAGGVVVATYPGRAMTTRERCQALLEQMLGQDATFREGRLAAALGVPYRNALRKVLEKPPQKEMENSYQQARNVIDAFQADPQEVIPGPVLLVDDIVDSRWSLTVCAMLLRQAGSGPVYLLALASAARGGAR
jgi:hypothetical protein